MSDDNGTPDPYRTPDGTTPDPYRGAGNGGDQPQGPQTGQGGSLPRYGEMAPGGQPAPPLYGADGQQSYGGGQQQGYSGHQGYQGQQGYQGAQPYYNQGYPGGGSTADNQLGNWSIGLAIAGVVCTLGFLTGIPAIILGMKGRRAAAEGRANNGGTATAGLVVGWAVTVLSILGMIFLFWLISQIDGESGFFSPEFWEELERELETTSR